MKALRCKYWLWFSLISLGICQNVNGQARYRRVEEPRWMTLNIGETSAGVFAEGRYEETTYDNNGSSIKHDHLFVGPSVGLNLNGSIYHPNLFRFRVNTEGAYGWGQDNTETPTRSMHRTKYEYLGRFNGSADILANKVVNGHIFSNYDHSYRDYDFFNRVTVDSFRYGAQLNYNKNPFSASLGYAHHEEDASGLGGLSHVEDDVITLAARHDREKGASTFNYTYSEYRRGDFGMVGIGHDHTVAISDSERFGAREQVRLNTGASYSRRESFAEPNDDISANANLVADHRPNLSSLYDLGFNHYSSGSFSSDYYTGRAQLRHQLYESLTSTLIAQASDNEFSDSFNSGYVRRFGGGFSEAYNKRLGEKHRLHIGNTFLIEHTQQDSISTVENERHVFSGTVGGSGFSSFFLNLPEVIEITIVVTDQNDTRPAFVRGIDYDVRTLGSRTIIERVPGSRIPDGSTVLVDYETQPTATGSYESLNEVFQIRFDLYDNFWGLYMRMNLYSHNAPEKLRVQNLTSYAFGTDLNWRWMRVGAEYEIYHSDQSDYNALRLFQSFSFRPDDSSTIGFEFSESWANYQDANRQEENYRFIMLYHRNLAARLRLDFDGGVHFRRGRGVDQTLATARPGIEYVIGQTTIKAGYDYQYQLYLDREERNKHLLFLRIKRVF